MPLSSTEPHRSCTTPIGAISRNLPRARREGADDVRRGLLRFAFAGGLRPSNILPPPVLSVRESQLVPGRIFPGTRRVGEHDFKAGAVTDIDQLQVHWFDHWLTGKDTGLLSE
jgi:hypothetical protein